MTGHEEFELALKHTPLPWRGYLIDVLDTAEVCVQWFRARGIEPSGDAVVKMTQLVLKQKNHDTE
jgi:hypothetical protein